MFVYYSILEDETKNKTNVNEGELTLLRSKVPRCFFTCLGYPMEHDSSEKT